MGVDVDGLIVQVERALDGFEVGRRERSITCQYKGVALFPDFKLIEMSKAIR